MWTFSARAAEDDLAVVTSSMIGRIGEPDDRLDRTCVDLGRCGVLGDPPPHLVRQDQLRIEVRQRHEPGGVGEPDGVGVLLLAEWRSRQHHATLRKAGLCHKEA